MLFFLSVLTESDQSLKIVLYPAGVYGILLHPYRRRESLDKRAVIDPSKCNKSKKCPASIACPAGAIEREDDDDSYFVNPYCQGCGTCVTYCCGQAIKIVI